MSDVENATPERKTFDLAAVLAGREYPKKTVYLYFDEAAGQEIRDLMIVLKLPGLEGKEISF